MKMEGYLKSVTVRRHDGDAWSETFKVPLTADLEGNVLTLTDERRKRVFLTKEIASIEVTTTNSDGSRALGWGLTAPGALILGASGASLAAIASQSHNNLSGPILLSTVTLPSAIAGVVMLAIGIPNLISGYREPEGARAAGTRDPATLTSITW